MARKIFQRGTPPVPYQGGPPRPALYVLPLEIFSKKIRSWEGLGTRVDTGFYVWYNILVETPREGLHKVSLGILKYP